MLLFLLWGRIPPSALSLLPYVGILIKMQLPLGNMTGGFPGRTINTLVLMKKLTELVLFVEGEIQRILIKWGTTPRWKNLRTERLRASWRHQSQRIKINLNDSYCPALLKSWQHFIADRKHKSAKSSLFT